MWTVHKPAWNNSPNCPLFSASCSPSYLLCACLLSHSPYPLSLSSGVPPKLQGWWSGTKPHRSISTHTLWHWLEPCQWPPGFYTQHFITHDKWIFFYIHSFFIQKHCTFKWTSRTCMYAVQGHCLWRCLLPRMIVCICGLCIYLCAC